MVRVRTAVESWRRSAVGNSDRAWAREIVCRVAARAARWALGAAFDHECVSIGQGGSIPFVATLQETFPQAQVLVTGIEDPDTRAHSEDESMHLGDLERIVTAEALLLARLGGAISS